MNETKTCENNHTMTGMGSNECPECEAPWKTDMNNLKKKIEEEKKEILSRCHFREKNCECCENSKKAIELIENLSMELDIAYKAGLEKAMEIGKKMPKKWTETCRYAKKEDSTCWKAKGEMIGYNQALSEWQDKIKKLL